MLVNREACASGVELPEGFLTAIEVQARRIWPRERIYIPPVDSRKDPEKGERIRRLAKRLPTGVVADRVGASRQLVSYHVRKKD